MHHHTIYNYYKVFVIGINVIHCPHTQSVKLNTLISELSDNPLTSKQKGGNNLYISACCI